jgi:hypothetical protein
MDSHTLEVMADQVDQEVEALRRREMEVELQLKFVSAKRATLRLLRKAIGDAQLVRNILIQRVFASVCMSV